VVGEILLGQGEHLDSLDALAGFDLIHPVQKSETHDVLTAAEGFDP